MGAYSKGGIFERGFKIFLVVGYIPVEIFQLVTYFFDVTHTSNRMFFKGQADFR